MTRKTQSDIRTNQDALLTLLRWERFFPALELPKGCLYFGYVSDALLETKFPN